MDFSEAQPVRHNGEAIRAEPATIAETPRLVLRPLAFGDLDVLVRLMGSLEVMRFSMTGPLAAVQVEQILRQFLDSYQSDPLSPWGVVRKSSGKLIGVCGFLQSRIEEPASTPGTWELGFRLLPSEWGQGYATEAAAACCAVARRVCPAAQIVALVEPANGASIRVLEKIGFRPGNSINFRGMSAVLYLLN